MISAFGVDHGLVSKGLPSALKTRKVGAPVPEGWRGNAILHRLNAHTSGKQAAKNTAAGKKYGSGEWAGMHFDRNASQGRYYGTRSKNMYKESLANDAKSAQPWKKPQRKLP